jgi:hypothetical protein
MRNRLIEILEQADFDFGEHSAECALENVDSENYYRFIADRLLAEGVIVPPCKMGDKVYVIDTHDFEPCKKSGKGGDVCHHLCAEYGFGYSCDETYGGQKPFKCAEIKAQKIIDITEIFDYWDGFGNSVFLTREEAEKALAERSEK